jgi:hypothetical protein
MADDRCYRVGAAFEAAYVAAYGHILTGAPGLGSVGAGADGAAR